jgi:hypothetical protein
VTDANWAGIFPTGAPHVRFDVDAPRCRLAPQVPFGDYPSRNIRSYALASTKLNQSESRHTNVTQHEVNPPRHGGKSASDVSIRPVILSCSTQTNVKMTVGHEEWEA